MFFSPERQDFFKPLVSKYREQTVQCLCLLYRRLYSANADYGHSLSRDQVVEILEEALARAPVLSTGVDDDDRPQRFKSTREQANWILKQLLDCGWLEKQVDTATLQSTYPFTRMGRLFSQTLEESDTSRIRTRHRNTRNTLNALEAFLSRGEIHDLLDAYDYSERIVTDFTDIIAELEERKRQLVKEVESQQLVQQATEQFFEFMEKRFQPDVAVRLSADSVEKYRGQISRSLGRVWRKDRDFKRNAEEQLRRILPDMALPDQSVLWTILDTIERRMNNAAEIMLPALRRALHSFTKRADIIIRQLNYLGSQGSSDVLAVCRALSGLPAAEYEERLEQAAHQLAPMKLQLPDPAQIKLHERKRRLPVQTAIVDNGPADPQILRELHIQQVLDQAFALDNQGLRNYIEAALRHGRQVSTIQLPITDAKDLLAMAHAVEVGAAGNTSGGYRFKVEPTGRRLSNDYYQELDEFTIELVEDND